MAKKTKAAATEAEAKETILAIKGFDKNLQCREFQFEVGKTYEQASEIEACVNGFHAVSGSPFDVWNHYPIVADDGSLNRWADVTLGGATHAKSEPNDSKIAAARITVDVELSLPAFIKKAVDWVVDTTKIGSSGYSAQIGSSGDYAKIGSSGDSAQIGSSGYSAQIGSSGDSAQIGSSGYSAKIGSSGHSAKIGSSGYSAKIGSSGYSAQIGSSGYSAKIGSSGDYAKIGSSGDSAKIGSSGDYAQIGSSGDSAQIGSSGYSAKIVAEGKNAVIAAAGPYTSAKGVDGTWIALAEFDSDGKCIGFATGCIGQDGLVAGTRYVAKGGKLVAA